MFKKEQNAEPKPKAAETIIGPSVKVKGNFHGDGNMIIEGTVEGSVKTKGNLFIGDKAKISASVDSNDARIGGEINGNIRAKGYLDITSTAQINGDIEANSLSIEKGAKFNGNCSMGSTHQHEEKKRE